MDPEHFELPSIEYPEYGTRSAQRGEPSAPHSGARSSRIPALQRLCEGEVVAQKYFVDRLLGRDGLAMVASVRHVELGRRYLLKMVPPDHCAFPDVVARFLRGARAAQALHSEHTARMIDAGRLDSGAPYAISEFIAGAPLCEVLGVRGALSVTEAVDYVLQTCEALAEAHLNRLVHKNLCLSRIHLTQQPDGTPCIKVSDFGIADALRTDPLAPHSVRDSLGTSPETSRFDDTLQYAAPEQVRGKDVDARTDIWAVGCMLHELLTGSPLYQADSASSLLAMIAADPPTPVRALRSDVPTGLEAVVLRCLEKDPSARYPTLGEFAAALQAFALPDARASANRIIRTLGRTSRQSLAHLAMVHVGPAPTPPPLPHPPSSTRPHPPPLPVLPPPPPRIDTREPRLHGALLAGLGLTAGVVLALLAVKFSSAPHQSSPNQSSTDGNASETELSLQRELVREIAALRAARSEPASAVTEQPSALPADGSKAKARAERPRKSKEKAASVERESPRSTQAADAQQTRADLRPASAPG
ncbi:MAG TPA: protein kinase, partial [Polyangiaceae bacterium]|nr:protein kinase [Polyangiaceae bacterium]